MGADYGSPSLSNPYLTMQTGSGGMPYGGTISRCNLDMGTQITISGINFSTQYEGTFTTACYINFYGSTTTGDYGYEVVGGGKGIIGL